MGKNKRTYIVPFVGLKIGFHGFEFEIGHSFFADRGNLDFNEVSVNVKVNLEKKETMMVATFSISGEVDTPCDRCADPVVIPISGEYTLVYKFGRESSEDESLVVLPHEAYELDWSDPIYEFILLSLPARVVHQPGECNEEMMKMMEQYTINLEDEEYDEDWEEEEWDEDEWDDEEEWDDESEDDSDDGGPKDDSPWSILKNLN